MHHKRRRTKNRRGGCLLCKPHKANGVEPDRTDPRMLRADASRRDQMDEVAAGVECATLPPAPS